MVERDLAKVEVRSSSLLTRSTLVYHCMAYAADKHRPEAALFMVTNVARFFVLNFLS